MKWYLAKLVFNIDICNGTNCSQFDEQLRLIEAESPEEAFFYARAIGEKEQGLFRNIKEEPVHWKFIDVAGVYLLPDLKHGVEIYTTTHTDTDSQDYINFIRLKASDLFNNKTYEMNKKFMTA